MTEEINIGTPPKCIADFCLIPIGTPTASVSGQIAEVQRLLKKSGLKYSMHSAGTTVGKLTSSGERVHLLKLARQKAHGTTSCD